MDHEESYRILDVPPSASPADIKLAYRRLAKVWHPDRFTGDSELQAMATAKLAAINQAYAYLKDHKGSAPNPGKTAEKAAESPQASAAKQEPSATSATSATKVRVTPHKDQRSPAQKWFDYGLDCFKRGQYTAATQYLADAIACDRYYLPAYELRYEALIQLGFEYRAKQDLLKIQELRNRFQRDQQVVRDRWQPVKPPAPSPPSRPAKPNTVPKTSASPANSPSPPSTPIPVPGLLITPPPVSDPVAKPLQPPPPPPTSPNPARRQWKFQVRWLAVSDQIASVHALTQTGRLMVVSQGGLVLILEKGAGRECLRCSSGFSKVACVTLSPSERILAIAHPQNSSILLLDLKNGQPLRRLMSPGLGARSLLFDPFGETLIAGCEDRFLRCWDVRSGRLKYQVSGHGAAPESLAFHQQDQQIWCAGAEVPLRLRQAKDGKLVRSLRGHESNTAIALSGNGQRLAVGGLAKLSILDLASRSCLHTFPILGPVKQVSFAGTDDLIVLLRNGDLQVLNWSSKEISQQINGSYTSFSLSSVGRELILVDRGGHLDIWTT